MNCFDTSNETMPADRLAQVQLERLQALLSRLKRNVRRYRDQLGDVRVESLADIEKLPVTEPEDLIAGFPYGMFALPMREVIRMHSVVGANGMQLVIGHTRNDLTHWGRLAARQLVAAGATAHDVIHICFARGMFQEALGYMRGAETIEASVISEASFHLEHQLAAVQNYRATVLITTPTNAQELARLLAERQTDPQSLQLKAVILSRPIPPEERESLRAGLSADVWCTFGVPEVLDPGLSVQCEQGNFHANEDQFLVEQRGEELLVTALCREGMPLLRYATRLACRIGREKCPCGRTGAILHPGARMDGLLRVNEIPVHKDRIADILGHTRAAGQPFRLDISQDRVVIDLALTPDLFTDTMRALVNLQQEIKSEFLSRLGIDVEVRYRPPRDVTHAPAAQS